MVVLVQQLVQQRMFAHVHQVIMVVAVNFETIVNRIHATMAVLVLPLTMVTSVNVHFQIRAAIVKLFFQHQLLDQRVLVSSVHVHQLLLRVSIHVFRIHVKIMEVVLWFKTLLNAIVNQHMLVHIVNIHVNDL